MSFGVDWKSYENTQEIFNMIFFINSQLHDNLSVILCEGYAREFNLPPLNYPYRYKLHIDNFLELAIKKLRLFPDKNIQDKISKHTKKQKVKDLSSLTKTTSPLPLLSPVITAGSLSILYAESGAGKTWVAMSIAVAVSFGIKAFHTWKAKKSHKVLYIDSELGKTTFNERIGKVISCYPGDLKHNSNNTQLTWEHANDIDISQLSGQQEINDLISEANSRDDKNHKVRLLILDNLSTLTNFTDSNKAWNSIHTWAKELAKKNIAVLVVHHSGKDGAQRGGTAKTVTADSVIRLDKVKSGPTKISLKVSIQKGRNTYGKHAEPFTIELDPNKKNSRWKTIRPQRNKEEQNNIIIERSAQGWKESEIADELQLSLATIKRRRNQLSLTKKRN